MNMVCPDLCVYVYMDECALRLQGLPRNKDGLLVTEVDLNLQQQIRDKWCFAVSSLVLPLSIFVCSPWIVLCNCTCHCDCNFWWAELHVHVASMKIKSDMEQEVDIKAISNMYTEKRAFAS